MTPHKVRQLAHHGSKNQHQPQHLVGWPLDLTSPKSLQYQFGQKYDHNSARNT
jgi:hypothetical protein